MNKGFSLIELMVVIAIVAVLAAVAAPAYKVYMTKATMVKTVKIMEHYKNKILLFYETNGSIPYAQDIEPNAPSTHLIDNAWSFFNVPLAQSLKLRNLWYGRGTDEFYMDAYFASNAFGDSEIDGKILKLYGRVTNGVWRMQCGSTNDTNGIPINKLPPGCTTVPVNLNN